MQWYFWVIGALAVLITVTVYRNSRIQKAGRAAREEMARRFGNDIRLISECGIVSPPSRVPGVLALLNDRLVYKSLSALAGGGGEIPLESIGDLTWERSWTSKHHMARKYRGYKVLGVTTRAGEQWVFAIANREAEAWEAALGELSVFHAVESSS